MHLVRMFFFPVLLVEGVVELRTVSFTHIYYLSASLALASLGSLCAIIGHLFYD